MKEKISLFYLKERYVHQKLKANENIKRILDNKLDDDEIIKRLHELAGEEGLIEIAMAYGSGDNGVGYYHCHLMLNLFNYKQGKHDNIIYLVQRYVPAPDQNYKWDEKEFLEIKESNFSDQLVLLQFMNRYTMDYWCRVELERLSERSFPTCVKTTGLSIHFE